MNKLWIVFLIFSSISFSQNIEEQIYIATEAFIANANNTSFQTLVNKETQLKPQIKTKDEALAIVFLLCHKAYYLEQYLQLNEAVKAYEEALKRFESQELSKLSDFDIVESCMIPLGNLYTKTGNFTNAESIILRYIYLTEKNNNKTQKISGVINLSKLYQSIDKHETTIKLISDYLNINDINPNQKQKLEAIYIESLNSISGNNLNKIAYKLDHNNAYKIAIANKDYKTAFNIFQKIKTEKLSNKSTLKRDKAKLLFEEAQLYFLLKHQIKASKNLDKALKILMPDFDVNYPPRTQDLYAENTFIDIFDLYAELQTDIDKALNFYDLSFYVSNMLRDSWTSQKTKILNQRLHKNRTEKCIDLLYNAFKNTQDKRYIVKAFQYSEASRASTLKEIFYKKLRLEKHPNDSLLIKEYNLLREQERVTGLLIKEQLDKNRATTIANLNKTLIEISFQIKTLKHKISKTFPEDENKFSLEILQKKLRKDQAVLAAYFYGNHTIYQFIVSADDISLNAIDLNAETKHDIIEFIRFFDNPSVINNDISKFRNKAFQLNKLLLFNKLIAQKQVIIIPDGLLNAIPFETLLYKETQTSSFAKMPFVVKHQNIVYNTSALLYTTTAATATNKALMGVFPIFKGTDRALTYALNEAETLKRKMSSELFMHDNATKHNFLKDAKNYGILHLSTHASGGNNVTPANIEFYDETLQLNELYSMDLNAQLVVLSACETGIGEIYKGEGAMSIARGFQYTGVKNLMFSLWQINDLSTSKIMAFFYDNYNKNLSASLANQASKLTYIENESIDNSKKSPYYWGAFVYYGDIIAPNTSFRWYYYVLIGIGCILIVLLLFRTFALKTRKTFLES
ncbi:hypothetical protein MHTCC0001_01850 [Flavobacteriaceae bacterium MHTCC 0001]